MYVYTFFFQLLNLCLQEFKCSSTQIKSGLFGFFPRLQSNHKGPAALTLGQK